MRVFPKSNENSREFRSYERDINLRNAKTTCVAGAILMLAGTVLDFVVYRDYAVRFLGFRAVSAILLILILIGIKRKGRTQFSVLLSMLIPLPPIIAICLMIYMTDGGYSTYYAGLNLVLVGLAIVLRWTTITAIGMTLLAVVAYVATISLADAPIKFKQIVNNFFFLFCTGSLVTIGSYYYEKLRINEFVFRKKVEEQNKTLEKNHEQLQELDEAKTRFFSNISHELRTPLTLILGMADSLRETEHYQKRRSESLGQTIDDLHSNALRLLKLIDDLLDLVKFDQQHRVVEYLPIDASAFFSGMVRSVRHLCDRKEIILSYKEKTPLAGLYIDQDKIEKIVLNLLVNAIKFTPSRGNITVETSWENDTLVIIVGDSGVGMEKGKLANVFNRFWQADSSSSRKFRGVGIGLSLVKSLVDVLDGEISVVSELDKGTLFRVSIPSKKAVLTEEDSEQKFKHDEDPISKMHRDALLTPVGNELEEPSERATDSYKQAGEHEFTILVADDEVDLRRYIVNQLKDSYNIIEARDGVEAYAFSKQYEPDVILLDYMMPEMNGLNVCKKLKKQHNTKNIPVIILTARADEAVKLDCLRCGASDFLSKPFALAELKLRTKVQIDIVRFRNTLHEKNVKLENAMEQLKENEVAMLRQEKLSSLGRMSAGIIHEINNPLNYVKTAMHMLNLYGKNIDEDERADYLETVQDANEGVDRVVTIISDLRSFATDDSLVLKETLLIDVIRSAEKLLASKLQGVVDVKYNLTGDLTIHGNANQLIQVFLNFFQNSLDAIQDRMKRNESPPGEMIIHGVYDRNTDKVILSFRDNGCGITEENQRKIFDPFFTQKDVGQGMGLGLSIVHQILGRHHVEVSIDSVIDEYTEFVLLFPANLHSTKDTVLEKT